jgi:uncharacterized protein involved in exopolysaccharide biosynthesis
MAQVRQGVREPAEVGNAQPSCCPQPGRGGNSEIQILSSRELIEKVLTTLKVETVYPDLAKDPLPR